MDILNGFTSRSLAPLPKSRRWDSTLSISTSPRACINMEWKFWRLMLVAAKMHLALRNCPNGRDPVLISAISKITTQMTTVPMASFKFSSHMNLKKVLKRYILPIACHTHIRCSTPTWTRMSPKKRPSGRHYVTRLLEIKLNICILQTKIKLLNQMWLNQKLKRNHCRLLHQRRWTKLHNQPSVRRAWQRPRRSHQYRLRSKSFYWRVECIQVKPMPVGWCKDCWIACWTPAMKKKSWWGISKTILNSILSRCWMLMESSMAIIDAH